LGVALGLTHRPRTPSHPPIAASVQNSASSHGSLTSR
jgi:hypothetical protein